jgi:26S proteasome regulatory subunit N6
MTPPETGEEEAMEVDNNGDTDMAAIAAHDHLHNDANVVDEDDDEDISDLEQALEAARALPLGDARQVDILLHQIIQNTSHEKNKKSHKATQLQERAVYDLTRSYCAAKRYDDVVVFLTGDAGRHFLTVAITKAKTAKVVRQVLEIVCTAAPDQLDMQESVARSIIAWTIVEKRSFLRQRVEAKLASILFQQSKYQASLVLCDDLLHELKKLDDKQLLVETHLLESKVCSAWRGVRYRFFLCWLLSF